MVTGHSWKRFDPRPRSSSPYTPIEEHFDSRVYELWERDRGNEPRCESSRRLSSVHGAREADLNVAERIELIRFRETVGKNITRIYIYIYPIFAITKITRGAFRFELFTVRLFRMNGLFYRRRKLRIFWKRFKSYRINTNSYLRSKICRFVNGGIGKQRVSMISVLRANR